MTQVAVTYTFRVEIRSCGFGNGGWVRLSLNPTAKRPVRLHVRAVESDDGRLRLAEVHVAGDFATGYVFRWLAENVTTLEAWFNSDWNETIRERLDLPGPDLETAISHYATTWGSAAIGSDGRGKHWVAEMVLSQLGATPQAPRAVDRQHRTARPVTTAVLPEPQRVGHAYPDEFYARYAAVYTSLIAAGRRPHPAIAAANNIPVTTSYRWSREATKRGYLASRGQGRVSR